MNVQFESFDHDPGHIEGRIVLRHSRPITNLIRTGYRWEEEDFGGWGGPRRIQVPVIEEIVVGYKTTWQVYTPEQYEQFLYQFE